MSAPNDMPPPPSPADELAHARDMAAQLREGLQRAIAEQDYERWRNEQERDAASKQLLEVHLQLHAARVELDEQGQQACGLAFDMGMALEEPEEGKRILAHRLAEAWASEIAAKRETEELRDAAVHAAAELRHAYRCKTDWNLVARAIGALERATTVVPEPTRERLEGHAITCPLGWAGGQGKCRCWRALR